MRITAVTHAGDKTVAMWLFDAEIYTGMSTLTETTPVIERGMALHKMIHTLTMCLGGEAWLTFMGNEFGHPEWIDFPREGNEWSHQHCRRQWSLADTGAHYTTSRFWVHVPQWLYACVCYCLESARQLSRRVGLTEVTQCADHLRYSQLYAFDRALNRLDEVYRFTCDSHQIVSEASDDKQVLVAERGALLFVFNFSPSQDYNDLKVCASKACVAFGRQRDALQLYCTLGSVAVRDLVPLFSVYRVARGYTLIGASWT